MRYRPVRSWLWTRWVFLLGWLNYKTHMERYCHICPERRIDD